MATYWVAKTGSDSNGGTSYADAKLTFAAGVALLTTGDTLIVCDGAYTVTGTVTISVSDIRILGGFNGTGTQNGQSRPTISKTGAGAPWSASTPAIDDNGSRNVFYLLSVDSAGLLGSAVDAGNYACYVSCEFKNSASDHCLDTSSFGTFVDCVCSGADGSNKGSNANTANTFIGCVFHDNGGDGLGLSTASRAIGCIAYGNGAYGLNGFTSGNLLFQCTAYDNASGNFRFTGLSNLAADCLSSSSSAGYGYISSSSRGACFNCVSLSDSSGVSSEIDTALDDDFVSSGSAGFADAASGLFSIGAGSAADGIGTPSVMTVYGTTTRDAGAIQRLNRGRASRRARRV